MAYGGRRFDEIEEGVEEEFADLLDFLLSLLTTKDGDFVTVAGDTPARTRWRVARMTSRWKGEVERLQAESQQVIDNCLRRARRKTGYARESELQMAAKHVQYINMLETGYAEIRRLINTVWPLHGLTLVKRLRGEGRVKTASAIGKRGGAVINKMLERYLDGTSIPSISEKTTTQKLPSPRETIDKTPTPETGKTGKLKKPRKFVPKEGSEVDVGDGITMTEYEEEHDEESEEELDDEEVVDAEFDDDDDEEEHVEEGESVEEDYDDYEDEELTDEDIEEALDIGDGE